MKNDIDALLEKARRSLTAARQLFDSDDFDFAASRVYYALFYVSEALLLKKQKSYSSHSAVMNGIYREYIQTNELPRSFHQTLHQSYKLREKSDYFSTAVVTREEAGEIMTSVERCMKLAQKVFP